MLDGADLSGVLLSGSASPHTCLFHWHDSNMQTGLAAVRCGNYKAHFATQKDYADAAAGRGGKSWPVGKHDPPLMFNVRTDPSETTPVDPNSKEFTDALAAINAARTAHLASVVTVCSQNHPPCGGNSGPGPFGYAVCGDPDSRKTHPQYPPCTSTPGVWARGKPCV